MTHQGDGTLAHSGDSIEGGRHSTSETIEKPYAEVAREAFLDYSSTLEPVIPNLKSIELADDEGRAFKTRLAKKRETGDPHILHMESENWMEGGRVFVWLTEDPLSTTYRSEIDQTTLRGRAALDKGLEILAGLLAPIKVAQARSKTEAIGIPSTAPGIEGSIGGQIFISEGNVSHG